ncbi:MAG: hypothetical protein HY787_26095 [Deltaproteobacteria bacterium]|nr:hypothetical protein [Deltaproteobacteria bacterium]
MNSDSVFEKRIGTLLKWRKRRRLFFFLVWFASFFLILNSLALGLQKAFHFDWGHFYLYWVLTLVSLGMALGFHLLTREKLLADLIEMDSRLRLKDRLSTAFEYQQSGRKSQFRERLLTDAGRVLEELPKNKLYPPRFSAAYVLIPSLALIMTGLSLFDFSPPKPTGEKRSPGRTPSPDPEIGKRVVCGQSPGTWPIFLPSPRDDHERRSGENDRAIKGPF